MVPKLYGELAPWFHLLTRPAEYAGEAEWARRLLLAACSSAPRTLLELGSGGGNNASHLKAHFALTLTDLSGEMLALSRALNPECEHVVGDMRTLRLGRSFDAVLVHDAISYMASEVDLAAALATAAVHCRAGGAALFMPDFVRETFTAGTSCGGHDAGTRALRYLEWTSVPDPGGCTYSADFALLLREGKAPPRVVQDRHVLGLFARDTWLRLSRDAGFEPRLVRDPWGRDVFCCGRLAEV